MSFNSIRTRLTFWLLVMTMIPLFMVSVAIYFYMVNSLKVSIYNRLEAVRDLKADELNHWLDERTMYVRTIAADDNIRVLEDNNASISGARDQLRKYMRNYYAFQEVLVVSPNTRKVMVSTDRNNEGKKFSKDILFKDGTKSLNLLTEDIHYSGATDIPCMDFSLPVFRRADSVSVTGFIVARVNLEASLYKLLNRMGMERTGEALLVNRDGIALNELRWLKGSALKTKLRSRPETEASQGHTGIIEAYDYRGEMVLAAYTFIPQTGWGFVAKQDLKEVYAPIYQLRRWMQAISVITFFGVIIVAFCVSRSISNPIKALHKGSEIIGKGDLNYKVGTDTKDEIGRLSRTFDLMIENLKSLTASRDDLNKEIAERRHLEKMLIEIKEHERRRIGYDLHDNLGQQLTAISFMTQGLENILMKKHVPEAEDAGRITYLIETAKAQVKSLSTGLSPILEKGEYSLITAMVDLAANSERLFGIPCTVKCNKSVLLYNEAALIHLYRIAQEAITNAARHARPMQIKVRLNKEGDVITMTIKDDGTGFTPSRGRGMGLEIMRYRAGIINASLDIHSDIKTGTHVRCIFPDTRESDAFENNQRPERSMFPLLIKGV
ncbi:MAG: HAMP domain-containing protein [Nitrospirae bacterium]|nr:HAMP domain-containing protein [Nitrospirota bacterium]